MMKYSDDKIREMISAYVDGELAGQEKEFCEALLVKNPEWQAYYKQILELDQLLGQDSGESLSLDGTREIQARLHKETQKEESKMKTFNSKSSTFRIGLSGGVAVALVLLCFALVNQGPRSQMRLPQVPSLKTTTENALKLREARDKAARPMEPMIAEKKVELARSLKASEVDAAGARLPAQAMARHSMLEVSYDMAQGAEFVTDEMYYMPPSVDEGWRYNDQFHTEEYDRIYENEFLAVTESPLSTFSIDVDTASYSNVRRFLNQGTFPPEDAVRIEELVNYFSYDYPNPEGDVPFSVTIDGAVCPWNKDNQLVRIGLEGKSLDKESIPASNLVFLIDVSGSMSDVNKLGLLKTAYKMMVGQLSASERVAIVVYAGSAGLVLDSTPGDDKVTILAAIDKLQAGGSTAGGMGIQLAYKVAKDNLIEGGNNRVILATDGDFNVGASSDAEMVRLIEEKREEGIALTVLGFGMGNYKDSKMEQLADKGNGNYYYIDTEREAKKVLVEELGSTLFTIAKDVKIQVEFNPAHVKAYRLIGYENRKLADKDFNDDTKDAGEIGAGHTVTALYEIVPTESEKDFEQVDDLKYQAAQIVSSDEILTVKLRYKDPDGDTSKLIAHPIRASDIAQELSGDFQFAAAVAEFGMILRNSEFKGTSSYAEVVSLAEESKGADKFAYRGEFIELVKKAESLDLRSTEGGIQFKGE